MSFDFNIDFNSTSLVPSGEVMSKSQIFSWAEETCKANCYFGFLTSGQFSVQNELRR
jgi:hypothetical protein